MCIEPEQEVVVSACFVSSSYAGPKGRGKRKRAQLDVRPVAALCRSQREDQKNTVVPKKPLEKKVPEKPTHNEKSSCNFAACK